MTVRHVPSAPHEDHPLSEVFNGSWSESWFPKWKHPSYEISGVYRNK